MKTLTFHNLPTYTKALFAPYRLHSKSLKPSVGTAVRCECRARQTTDFNLLKYNPTNSRVKSIEYLDYIISVKIVGDIDEAIEHINEHNTKHSEAIVTENYENSQKFLNEIDAACVYVNASTRFTDGFEFGFGAEIGISTQKLHARGPMGLKELTTTKYIIYGNGQVRS